MTSFDTLLAVSRETEQALRKYLDLLMRWNSRINLVASATPETLWHRHILDSVQLGALLPPRGPIVDLGSGAGFPGLVLALISGHATHLVESDRRKCAFLQEAVRVLGLSKVQVHNARIEAASLPQAGILTARALAPLPVLLHHAHCILDPDGVAIFPKGRSVEHELTAAAPNWTMRVEKHPSLTDPDSTILRLSEIRPVSLQS